MSLWLVVFCCFLLILYIFRVTTNFHKPNKRNTKRCLPTLIKTIPVNSPRRILVCSCWLWEVCLLLSIYIITQLDSHTEETEPGTMMTGDSIDFNTFLQIRQDKWAKEQSGYANMIFQIFFMLIFVSGKKLKLLSKFLMLMVPE